MESNSSFDFVCDCGCDVEYASQKARELDELIEKRADQKASINEEKRFNAHREEFQLEVLKLLQEEGIRKEGVELSSASPLISDTYIIDGVTLLSDDFIPDSVETDPLYEETSLIKSPYSLEYQEVNHKTGKRKLAWKESATLVLICNPIAYGKCEEIDVFLKGVKKPLRFPNGEISEETFRRQTPFARKGINVSVKRHYESFLRSLRECPNKKFLTIPKHAGGIKLQNGVTTYISSESVIPGLEELFPQEVRDHKMVAHALPLKDMVAIYRKAMPNCLEAKIATIVRTESLLLPWFEAEGLHPDCGFSISYTNDAERETAIALTKRKNYSSTVVQALTDRIPKVRKELSAANDVTVLFTFSGIFDEGTSLDNAFKEIMWDINGENGDEDGTRKIIVILTDIPERIPDDYPVYYINCSEDIVSKNVPVLQRLAGMLDYSFKEYLYNNPDTAKQLVRDGIKVARHIVSTFSNVVVTDIMKMTLATAHILERLGVVTDSDFRGVIRWLMSEASSRLTMTDLYCNSFKSAVSNTILSKELKLSMQFGPLFYSDDGYTAFFRTEDKSINLSGDTLKNVIIPKTPAGSVTKMNKHAKEKGMLIAQHTNKRKLKVAFGEGLIEDVEVFSYKSSVLNAEAKAYVDDIINNEYWFNIGEYPDGFVPVLYNADGTRVAGYVFNPDMDDNFHEVYFGYTRSGKTFAMTNRAVQMVEIEGADAVLIFDQTGGFSPEEVDKHIGKELRSKYFSFWNVYEDGVPVNLLDLRGCRTLKEERERIFRIYAMMTKSLGSYQEPILKIAVNCLLRQMKKDPDMKIEDIINYIEYISCNDDGEPVMDEAHRKLCLKLKTIIEDLVDMPVSKNNWGEFVKAQDKPIIVISTGADSVGKGSEIIDMMLESIYGYKQCFPSSRYTVVIDEAQDLYLHEKGAVNVLLRKGGKHGITILMASQSFPDPNVQFGKVVGNCGRLRSYHPKADDLKRAANYFNCGKEEVDFLQQGECFDKGPFWSRYRNENVINTLRGKTVVFEPAAEIKNDTEEDEQP
ncbi:hypothetical protein SAMN02910265_01053 [Ruminococcus flavefaciens]|uniref:AAA-like domain-containing protein n=1 Tax=Ruminococcus flavefaciens TaxID=1265 RepID=A0A1H6IRA9_RUMFL|nr:hypothetical protein [Ruminococcus flavefaciens]SEH50550.1 hypothetical protein SAMN02910265_01053 [Ruminococcus flavefaciens]